MELRAHMFKAERARAIQICRDNALEAELSGVEERERRYDIMEEDHVRLLG